MNSTNINAGLNPILGNDADADADPISSFCSAINHLAQTSVSFTETLRASPIMQWAMAFDAMLKEIQKSPGMKALIEMSNNLSKIKIDSDILKIPPLGLPLR